VKKNIALLLLGILSSAAFGQQDGYWDKERATTKEIIVSARDRIVIKTDDFPVGTTELIYRITLLEDNQQLATSLVSVLKAIPDPTGISQGSAGAVFLLSKVSGDDKSKYAIFSANDIATAYQKSGKTYDACFVQDEAISKDANRLSIDKSTCLKTNTTNLWFGFESKNWIMKQKIVLEVVPWVDRKLARGWSTDNRKYIINQCKTSAVARKMPNSDDFCICLQQKIQKEYTFQEFQKLLPIEQAKVYKDFGTSCVTETNVAKGVSTDMRTLAAKALLKCDFATAIKQYVALVSKPQATALDYNGLGYSYLITKQYGKAIKVLKDGETKDNTELLIQLNLAHAYLLNGDYRSAKSIYKEYQNQNVTDSLSWIQKIKDDFIVFKKAGLPTKDFDRILKMMD
jgi:tetratricopeptide (TPR) repeat protein